MKRILITGANKGIGLATVAKLLGSYDETFLLLGSRDSKKGQQALNSLVNSQPEWKDRLDLIQIDVEQDLSVNSAAEEVATKFGRTPSPLYAIVNNAGIGNSMLGLNKILQVNTFGPKRVCDAFLPLLNPSIGRVVNVTSASGPLYLAGSSNEIKKLLTNPEVSWTEIEDSNHLYILPENTAVLTVGNQGLHLTSFEQKGDQLTVNGHSVMMGYMDDNQNEAIFRDGGMVI